MKFASILLLVFAAHAVARAKNNDNLESMLRLQVGNSWVYQGTAEWDAAAAGAENPRIRKAAITWKIEVLERQDHGDAHGYLVRGSFSDLPWYQPSTQRGLHLWIIYQNRFYEISADARMLRRFHDPKASLTEAIRQEQPLIQLPLDTGKCAQALVPNPEEERHDLMYCWYIDSQMVKAVQVAGIAARSATVSQLWFRSNPEHEILEFAPGIGMLSFIYAHHGSTSNVDVHLVKADLK